MSCQPKFEPIPVLQPIKTEVSRIHFCPDCKLPLVEGVMCMSCGVAKRGAGKIEL